MGCEVAYLTTHLLTLTYGVAVSTYCLSTAKRPSHAGESAATHTSFAYRVAMSRHCLSTARRPSKPLTILELTSLPLPHLDIRRGRVNVLPLDSQPSFPRQRQVAVCAPELVKAHEQALVIALQLVDVCFKLLDDTLLRCGGGDGQ